MAKMIDNALYDKIKLIHDLSKILWFIQKHCHEDMKICGDTSCTPILKNIERDLSKYIEQLTNMLCK